MNIKDYCSDPLDIMNSVMVSEEGETLPRRIYYYERRIAMLCDIIAEKNKEVERLENKLIGLTPREKCLW